MHEFSVAQSIANTVFTRVSPEKLRKITLDIGTYSGVFPDSLKMYLELIVEERGAKGVELEMNKVPASCRCSCGESYKLEKFHDPCPKCGGYDREITEGKDCMIRSVEAGDA